MWREPTKGSLLGILREVEGTHLWIQENTTATVHRGALNEVGIPRREADKVHEGQLLQGLEFVGGTHHKVCDKVGLGAGGSTAKRHQDRRRRQKSTLHADDVG